MNLEIKSLLLYQLS